jgi:hypothetical protein
VGRGRSSVGGAAGGLAGGLVGSYFAVAAGEAFHGWQWAAYGGPYGFMWGAVAAALVGAVAGAAWRR